MIGLIGRVAIEELGLVAGRGPSSPRDERDVGQGAGLVFLVLVLERIDDPCRRHLPRIGVLATIRRLLRAIDALLPRRPILEGAAPALHDLHVVDAHEAKLRRCRRAALPRHADHLVDEVLRLRHRHLEIGEGSRARLRHSTSLHAGVSIGGCGSNRHGQYSP